LTVECPCECPVLEISFPGRRRETRSVLIAIRDLSPNQGSKNPLRAESARGPGLWATEEAWEPREVSCVCCGAGHQDDQLSTDREVALQRGPLEGGSPPPRRCD